MSTPNARELERLRYFQGQTLGSRDFRDEAWFDAVRRSAHNRTLHRAFGVNFGLEVGESQNREKPIVVECGLAYDASGAELLLQRRLELAAPTEPGLLVLRRQQARGPRTCAAPSCDGAPAAFDLDADLECVWLPASTLAREGVVLARSLRKSGKVVLDPEFQRRLARPLARPRLARGETVRGNTSWERWEIDEPSAKGGFVKRVVGVQTRVDTSAAGFSETPCYFASLVGPAWDVAKTEFTPTFFPSVAEESVDGFTFRLLMLETTRRRYVAVGDTDRIQQSSIIPGNRLEVELASATGFREHDQVALLRPRGESAHFIVAQEGTTLTLDAALPDTVTLKETRLALGNAPRVATLTTEPVLLETVRVAFIGATLKKNDVLVRSSDQAVTTIDAARGTPKVLTINAPFPNWKLEDDVGFALRAAAAPIESVSASAQDPDIYTITLETADATLGEDEQLVLWDEHKAVLPGACHVLAVSGATLRVRSTLGDDVVQQTRFVGRVSSGLKITAITRVKQGETIEVDAPLRFREGDFVAAVGDASAITVIDAIEGARLTLREPIGLSAGASIVAANWVGATTVVEVSGEDARKIRVGRAGVVAPPCLVVRKEGAGFGRQARVATANATQVDLVQPIDGLAALDVLAIGVFPRVVTVVLVEPGRIRVAEAGSVRAGEILVPLDGAAPAPLLEVVSASGDALQFRGSPEGLLVGARLGVVEFRDTALLNGVSATTVELDRELETRDADFVAVLTHYVENSAVARVQSIAGSTLTLGRPGIENIDGIVPEGFIDGGILGQASVSFQTQPLFRLEASDGLASGTQAATLMGYDTITGQFRTTLVQVYLVDAYVDGLPNGSVNRVIAIPTSPLEPPFSYRPETLALTTTFNADFPNAFATFAQKQRLSVAWVGCQPPVDAPRPCPGTSQLDACEETNPCKGITPCR